MYIREIIYFIILIGFYACYSPSTTTTPPPIEKSTKVKIKDYSFLYDTNQTTISGYFNIALVDPLDNSTMPQGLELTNFVLDTQCIESSYKLSSDSIHFLDNIYSKKIDLNISLLEPCNQLEFTLTADKIIRSIENGDDKITIEMEKWSKIFKIYSINKKYKNIKLDIPTLEVNNNGSIKVKFLKSSNSDIESVKLTISDTSKLKFTENLNSNIYTYTQEANKTIAVKSFFKSGETDIKLEAIYIEKEKEIIAKKLFKVIILSAPINSISIVEDINRSRKRKGAFFENSYQIHAIDKYGNIANQVEHIYIGAINGIRKGENGKYLTAQNNGEIIVENNVTKFVYNNTNLDFNNINILEDKLLILAKNDKMDLSYLGAWSISKYTSSSQLNNNIFYLNKDYTNRDILADNLKFVIGNSKRYNKRTDSISIVNIDRNDTIYRINENGSTIFNGEGTFKLQYDPDLLGRSVFIYANIITKDKKRIGASINELLGGGIKDGFITSTPINIINEKNATLVLTKDIFLHTEDNLSIKNALVSASSTSGNCEIVGTYDNISSKTNSDGNAQFKITIEALGKCTVEITHIFKDTDKENYD